MAGAGVLLVPRADAPALALGLCPDCKRDTRDHPALRFCPECRCVDLTLVCR